jgi:HEAT repeat protein
VRYAGDEFVLLLPRTRPLEARQIAERMLSRTAERPFRLRDSGAALPVSVSIGIATAPDDGQSPRELIQRADAALYHAKRSGRNQAASARDVDPAKVFGRTAAQQLDTAGLAGRDRELMAVQEALGALGARASRFLLFEGAPGLGKSALIENVRRIVASDPGWRVVKAAGVAQESYRPFHLATQLLWGLLNLHPDRGSAILRGLSEAEIAHLPQLLPELTSEPSPAAVGDPANRRGLFNALLHLTKRLADPLPLVVLVDDLHCADEASLHLLRVLLTRRELPTLVCAAAAESLRLEAEPFPLSRFCEAHPELPLQRLQLRPLTAHEIADHLRAAFPGLSPPADLPEELAQVTAGSPLFLVEILRKLAADEKIRPFDEGWELEPLAPGYLPRSIEEIVRVKVAALDHEEQQLLAQASALGEAASLSALVGSASAQEIRVLEFVDRAEALGLLRLDFDRDDETLRFLGKAVLDITRGGVKPERLREAHERAGEYHERLFEQRLLPSASLLAWHFKRAANEEKATRYQSLHRAYERRVFDASEAAAYSGEALPEPPVEAEEPEPDLALVPRLLRALQLAVRSVQLYPAESQPVQKALAQAHDAAEGLLASSERVLLTQAQRALVLNGQRLDVSEYRLIASSFLELMARAELQGLGMRRGLPRAELDGFVKALGRWQSGSLPRGFWRQFVAESSVEYLDLMQVRYTEVRRAAAGPAAAQAAAEERPLEPSERGDLARLLRALTGAVRTVRLYPLDSGQTRQSLEQMQEALTLLLARHGSVSLAGARGVLFANGERVPTGEFRALAEAFEELMESLDLSSLTFRAGATSAELEAFLAAVRDLPAGRVGPQYWESLAQEKRLSGLAFNRVSYGLDVLRSLRLDDAEAAADAAPPAVAQAAAETLAGGSRDELRETLLRYGAELVARGDVTPVWQLIGRLFDGFESLELSARERTLEGVRAFIESLVLAHQHQVADLASDHLVGALAAEREPRALAEIASALYTMVAAALQFSDHTLAARLLQALRSRGRELQEAGAPPAAVEALDRRLDATAQNLLADDLQSADPLAREKAAQVAGQLGPSHAGLLIDVIRQQRSFRIRQSAATLLAQMGPQAALAAKRELALEVTAEQRFRLLEVIDSVTRDLKQEIALCLRDTNGRVRQAAFRLAERLRDASLAEVLADCVRHGDPNLARGAVRAIAALPGEAAVPALVSLLQGARSSDLATSCCQALGRFADPDAVQALAAVLRGRTLGLFGRRWDDQVRAVAAQALSYSPHPSAAAALAPFGNDRDARVKSVAQAVAQDGPRPLPPPEPLPDPVGERENDEAPPEAP